MKKTLIGIFQIVIFIICYYLIIIAFDFIFNLLVEILIQIPILQILVTGLMLETIRYVIIPFVSATLMVIIEKFVTSKTLLYFPCYIIIMVVCIYLNVNMIVSTIFQFGLISWNFANILCYAVILCGVIGYGLFQQTDFKLEKK